MSKTEPVLVDTHALLWWRAESGHLSATAKSRLKNASMVLVSPMRLREISPFHGNPVDRILMATARVRRLALITKDQQISAYASASTELDVVW